jgi:hypothetical protein
MDGTARVEPGGGSPDPPGWSAINDPEARLRTALGEVYSYNGRAESMLARAEQEAPMRGLDAAVFAHHSGYSSPLTREASIAASIWTLGAILRSTACDSAVSGVSAAAWRSNWVR